MQRSCAARSWGVGIEFWVCWVWQVISWSSQRGNFPAYNLLGTSSCWQSEIGMKLCSMSLSLVDACWVNEHFVYQDAKCLEETWRNANYLRTSYLDFNCEWSIFVDMVMESCVSESTQDSRSTLDFWVGGRSSSWAMKCLVVSDPGSRSGFHRTHSRWLLHKAPLVAIQFEVVTKDSCFRAKSVQMDGFQCDSVSGFSRWSLDKVHIFWCFTQNIEHDHISCISWALQEVTPKRCKLMLLGLHAMLDGHLVILVALAKLCSQRRRFSTNSPMGPWQTAWTFFAGRSVRISQLNDGNNAFLLHVFDGCQ